MNRRDFLKFSSVAAGTTIFFPQVVRASSTGQWLSGYGGQDGGFGVVFINEHMRATPLFRTPHRLHGISKHPHRNEVVAPSRRPGDELFVFNMDDQSIRVIQASNGRHYFGHGVFSPDGRHFYAVENAFDDERGVIGVYDTQSAYKRIGEFDSGGIGPHEVKLHPDGRSVFVANGGILTHPKTGRAKLNLDSMMPTLTELSLSDGATKAETNLPRDMHQLSIRHIDVGKDGTVYVGVQDQNKVRRDVPLVWKWQGTGELLPFERPSEGWGVFKGYIGSVTVDSSSQLLCVSSPRGNIVQQWNVEAMNIGSELREKDICGIAAYPRAKSYILTTGTGKVINWSEAGLQETKHSLQFDNHCTGYLA